MSNAVTLSGRETSEERMDSMESFISSASEGPEPNRAARAEASGARTAGCEVEEGSTGAEASIDHFKIELREGSGAAIWDARY